MNNAIPVFRAQYLATAGAASITSAAMPIRGNKAVLSVIIINSVNTPTFSCQMQASYDGVSWVPIGTAITQSTFGSPTPNAVGSLDYAFIRVYASCSGASAAILFDATVSLSEQ